MSLVATYPHRPFTWPALVEQLATSAPDPSRLYLVGGVVRDALRGVPTHDLDLTTPDDGLKVAKALADTLGGAYYPVDPQRHTGRVLLPTTYAHTADQPPRLDVASFRGADLLDDLRGRDFTVNALAVRLDDIEQLIDPLGGQDDLFRDKLLRQCNPSSIADDPIRALRAVRLALQLGLRLESQTLKAVQAAPPTLLTSTGELQQPERVRDELFRMLSLSRAAGALRLLHTLGLLAVLYPFELPAEDDLARRFTRVEKLANLLTIISPQRTDETAADLILGTAVMVLDRHRHHLQTHLNQAYGDGRSRATLVLLAALTLPASGAIESWGERLRLSRAETRILSALQAAQSFNLLEPLDDRAVHRYYRAVGPAGIDGVLLSLADYLAEQPYMADPLVWGSLLEQVAAPALDAYFNRHQTVIAPPPLLDGHDLMNALGLKPGPELGRIMAHLAEEQAAGTIQTRDEAIALTKRLLTAQGPTSTTNGS